MVALIDPGLTIITMQGQHVHTAVGNFSNYMSTLCTRLSLSVSGLHCIGSCPKRIHNLKCP